MVKPHWHRRAVLSALGALACGPTFAGQPDVVDLGWSDLLPPDAPIVPRILSSMVDHGTLPLSSQQPKSTGRRTEWDGKTVRIRGFVIPLTQSAEGVTAFILAPYVGACIHVPPPPANQLIFVTAQSPFTSKGLFEAVKVTGTFAATSTYTDLAQIGYALTAETVTPFDPAA